MPRLDVLVLGAGPAGTLLASALAARGARVGLLGAVHPAPWPNNYGAWEDDLPAEVREHGVAARWDTAAVGTGGPLQALPRAYVRLDNARLQAWALARAPLSLLTGEAAAVEEEADGALTVRTAAGASHTATLVVDATGARSPFARWGRGPAPGVQTAWGVVADVTGADPLQGHACVLMDWSDAHLDAAERQGPPSFLYGMRLPDGRVFLEETVLVARPAIPLERLEARLHTRLAALGTSLTRVHETERCWIPMGGAAPRREGPVVGFGGAARMEHPATGYLLTRALRALPRVADGVHAALALPPAEARRAAWDAVWPKDALRARALWVFGMETLLGMDAPATRRFFEAFFRLPAPDWQGYMSGTLDARPLSQVMWRVFQEVPAPLRLRLMRAGMGAEGARLAGRLLAP
jgi:lycopene beta-cyclase